MVTLAIVAAITALTVLLARMSVQRIAVAATVGLLIGAAMDWLLGYQMGLWYYTHHPYWMPDYFYLLYPAWVLASVMLVVLKDIVSNWMPRLGGVVLVVTTGMIAMGIHEAVGAARDAWRYDAPVWLVLAGWPVYIWFLSFCVDKVQYAIGSAKTRRTV